MMNAILIILFIKPYRKFFFQTCQRIVPRICKNRSNAVEVFALAPRINETVSGTHADADQSNQNQQVEVLVSAPRIKKTVIGTEADQSNQNQHQQVEVVDLSPKIKVTVIGTQAS